MELKIATVNPQKRPAYSFSEGPDAGLIRILPNFCTFAYCFLSFLRVLLECGTCSRAGLFQGFTVNFFSICEFRVSFLLELWNRTELSIVQTSYHHKSRAIFFCKSETGHNS